MPNLRRVRTAWLRKQRSPEDLIKFWLGHSESSVTDFYSKLADDVERRRQVAEKVGTGFEVSACEATAMRPKGPKKSIRAPYRFDAKLLDGASKG